MNVARDALARSICARICDERHDEHDLRRIERVLDAIDREPVADQLRVYVAAASDSMSRVHAAIDAMRAAGIDVVCTWPEVIAKVGNPNPRDASRLERFGWSAQDLAEVAEADLVWFLVPSPGVTRGAWFELGFAYCDGRPLVLSGDTKQSVFCALGAEFADDEAALAHVLGVAKSRALVASIAAKRRRERIARSLSASAAVSPACGGRAHPSAIPHAPEPTTSAGESAAESADDFLTPIERGLSELANADFGLATGLLDGRGVDVQLEQIEDVDNDGDDFGGEAG